MVRAVVDTNVFVSGATGSSSPAEVLDSWREGHYVLVTSESIIEEIAEVLRRPKIRKFTGLAERDIKGIINSLETRAFVVAGEIEVDLVEDDPEDNKFLACAIEGLADYIVTGDKHLLSIVEYQGIEVVKPREFLKKLRA